MKVSYYASVRSNTDILTDVCRNGVMYLADDDYKCENAFIVVLSGPVNSVPDVIVVDCVSIRTHMCSVRFYVIAG